MHITATLKEGPVYKKWLKLNQPGGVLHGTKFSRVGVKKDTIYVAHEIVDLDKLKADPHVVVEMTSTTVAPDAPDRPDGFRPDALSQGIVDAKDADEFPAHVNPDVPAEPDTIVDQPVEGADEVHHFHHHHHTHHLDTEELEEDKADEAERARNLSGDKPGSDPFGDADIGSLTPEARHHVIEEDDEAAEDGDDDGDEDAPKPTRKRGRKKAS